jgi:hypothetical protein
MSRLRRFQPALWTLSFLAVAAAPALSPPRAALAQGPAPGEIVFPVVLPPIPPPPPPDVATALPAGVFYVVQSDKPFFCVAAPEGLVTVTAEPGPLRVRGKFAEAPDAVQTKTFTAKFLVVVEAAAKGRCEIIVWPAGSTDPKQVQRRAIDAGGEAPGPGPGPGPGPDPFEAGHQGHQHAPSFGGAPGLKVLVVYDRTKLASMPAEQLNALSGAAVRDYLRAKCAKEGPNNWPAYRVWADDVPTGGETELWQKAMKRPRKSLPWVVIGNGKAGFEGPLPATEADILKLVQKYGGA